MTAEQPGYPRGFTLIETMVAMVILTIAAFGALGYQYYAAKQAHTADAEITATRTALLLLEDWKSTGGSANYDPTTLGLGFSSYAPSGSSGAIYSVTVEGLTMLVKLQRKDVGDDSTAGASLREISVAVSCSEEQDESVFDNSSAGDRLATFTTYVRSDASGG